MSLRKAFLLMVLISPLAKAGTLQCSGTVEKIGLHASDKILLKLSSMNQAVFVCSPNSNWSVSGTGYTTSKETCNSMLSMFMHAKSTKAEMGKVWFDGKDVPSSCDSWESWKTANVRFFMY